MSGKIKQQAFVAFLAIAMVGALAAAAWVFAADSASVLASLARERAAKTQPVEDAAGAMTHFYQALYRTATKQPDAVTHVIHFGDSLIEMELLPGPMRRLLQQKWGDCGHGFVLSSRPKAWYIPYDLSYDPAPEWISYDMKDTKTRDRCFGLGGATGIAVRPNAWVKAGTTAKGVVGRKVSRFEVLFPIEPTGGPLDIKVDGSKVGTIDTAGAGYQDGYAEIPVPDGPHAIEITARKKDTRLQGIVLDREGPGVIYDACGINGSGVTTYLSADKTCWENALRHRNPDLVLIGVGTNDTSDSLDLVTYKQNMQRLVLRVREALPNASIMLVAPLDRARKQGAELVTHPTTPKIVATQRALAREMGVAFWSAFDAMGGVGSMARWYNARPQFGAGDFFHPTPKGGEVLGEMFYNALMQGFADYIAANPALPPAAAPPADPLTKLELTR